MSAEGLWTIQFAESEEVHGGLEVIEEINRGGSIVLVNNKVYGAGISFYFVGTYEETDGSISLTINCTRYNNLVPGQFGPKDEARLVFMGNIDNNTMSLHGQIEDNVDKTMLIKAIKRTDLN